MRSFDMMSMTELELEASHKYKDLEMSLMCVDCWILDLKETNGRARKGYGWDVHSCSVRQGAGIGKLV